MVVFRICGIKTAWALLVLPAVAFVLLAQRPQETTTPTVTATAILVIQTDLDCNFALDDGAVDTLKAGVIKKIPIVLGEHLVNAVSLDGKDRWKSVVVADKPLQKVVLIELQKVRATRERDEKEAAQLEREIQAKRDQAAKLREAATGAATRQEAIKLRKTEIGDRIAAIQKQIQQEQAAAQNDDASAQQSRSCAASEPKTTVGTLGATACNAMAADSENSARRHRANIANLQNQLVDLNRLMGEPDAGLGDTGSTGVKRAPSSPGPRFKPSKQRQALATDEEGLRVLESHDSAHQYEAFPGVMGRGSEVSIRKSFYFRWCAGWEQRGADIILTGCTFGIKLDGKWKDYRNFQFQGDQIIDLSYFNKGDVKVTTGIAYKVVFAVVGFGANGAPTVFAYLIRPRGDPGVLRNGAADRNRKK